MEVDDEYHTMEKLKCGHNVHLACIAEWGELYCPLCKQDIFFAIFNRGEDYLKKKPLTILHCTQDPDKTGEKHEVYFAYVTGRCCTIYTGLNQKMVGKPTTIRELNIACAGMRKIAVGSR